MYEYNATYHGLRDADTLFLSVDPGFYLTVRTRPYRLMRVNAWEKKKPGGKAAMDAVDALMRGARSIRVQTFRQKIPSGDPELTFDRWLAEVWADQVNVGDFIVANGHGEYKSY
jgi:endonuclease YncB( thermonuclease family)